MKLDIPCVIFAGGKSSRMGQDKSLLPFGGFDTLIEYQYTKLSQMFNRVYISAKENKFSFTCTIIEDKSKVFAPTSGFSALFTQLKDERVFVVSVDTPFIEKEHINTLLDEDSETFDATIAQTALAQHPLCGIYHRSLHVQFDAMLKEGKHKLGYLLKTSNTHWVMFEEERAFMNLNYFDEYQRAFTM